jgi:signal transduction histidine kinase/ActR/RegA family two-component response regulator
MLTISAAVISLAFIVTGVTVWLSQNGLVASSSAVTHSRHILADVEMATSDLSESIEADNLCRDEKNDEACYRKTRNGADFRATLRELRDITPRDPIQQDRIIRIQTHLAGAMPTDMRRPDAESTVAVRDALRSMKTFEQFRLSRRLDRFNAMAKSEEQTTAALLILAATLLVGGLAALLRGIGKQRTSQRQLERLNSDLAVARREALALSEAKGRFLADMSHEIRTPLNGIVGMSSMLEVDKLSQEHAEIIRTIRSSSDILLRVVDDVLDLSKIEANRVELLSQPLDIHALVWDVANLYRGLADEAQNVLIVDVPSEECWVLGDAVRLKQIIGNLISNAVKFCRAGEVHVSTTKTPDQRHVIRVTDTGIGIAPDRLQSIFDEFVQAHLSVSSEHGGTGLGLAIARKLVTRMGGDVRVRSKLGEGSEFEVELPLPSTEPPCSKASKTVEISGLRILLAEDNEVNILVATSILERAGCKVDVARDGVEATDKAISGEYDVVLMDLRMPLRDGVEATKLIVKEFRNKVGRPRIIAMTANASAEDRDSCLRSGMDGFLPKPFTYDLVVESLQIVASARA